VLLGVDGVSDFDGLHSRKFDPEVQFYAFDTLMLEGEDLRQLPLSMRKTDLARLLARRPEGIFVAPFEQARSVRICSGRPASSSSRGWCRSIAAAPDGRAGMHQCCHHPNHWLPSAALGKLDEASGPYHYHAFLNS
jgi:hypothetical protein